MFKGITKKRKNPIFNIAGWGLLVLVCGIFMFVGYSPDVSFMGGASAVASVNGEAISFADYSRYYERVQEGRQDAKMGKDERQRLQSEVVNSLVNRSLILQTAKKQGIIVGSEEIRDYLMQVPQFQDEKGKFSVLKYKELIRAQGMSEAHFEGKVAEDMIVQKMNMLYQMSAADDKLIQDHEDTVSKIKMDIQFIRKGKSELVSDSEVTDAEVTAFMKDNQDKIKKYYEEKKSTVYTQKESVQAQHILIKITPEFSEDKALAKIKDVASKITDGNFAEMAKKFSEDPGSQSKGGDLGTFGRGRMVPEFDQAAFSTPIGKVSEPFKTSFGYHILKVNQRFDEKVLPLDDTNQRVIARLLIKDQKVGDAVKKIKDALAAGPAGIQSLISQKAWTWEETGPFGLGDMMIPKIGDNQDVVSAAMTLTNANPIYKDVVVKDDVYYIVKLKSITMNAVASKEPTMDIFKQIFERQKTMESFQAWMDQLRKNASIKINENVLSQN